MKIRVLGCSGAIAQDCRTTSFLIDHDLLVDAGTGVGDLTLDEMRCIDHVLLTHAHLDHIAALPLMLDAVAGQRDTPVHVHALPETIAALKAHVFNDLIWPDFSVLPSKDAPFIRFETLRAGQQLRLAAKDIRVLPAVHTVPAVGYAVSGHADMGYWVFTGDTGPNPALWSCLSQLHVAMLVIETAFSSQEELLAQRSLHLSPQTLARELAGIVPGQRYPIYITHTKPAQTAMIMAEIERLDRAEGDHGQIAHDISWLQAGQMFEF